MRSSGNTRNLREPRIALGLLVVGDDHPRACTGRRLIRQGLARSVPRLPAGSVAPVVLDPYAPLPLSGADVPRAERAGLFAVDCSWNRLSAGHGRNSPGTPSVRLRAGRRLPMLLAGNPQHFGRLGELNTAEALAAGLWVLGASSAARRLLAGFAGGPAFLEMNAERLDRYVRAGTPERVVDEERALFGPPVG